MRWKMGLGAIGLACLAFGCASVMRPLEAKTRAKLMPADKQAAATELALDRAQVEKLKADIAQLDALKAAHPKLDNESTAATISEANANIAWYEERIKQIEAIKDTLPERPDAGANAGSANTNTGAEGRPAQRPGATEASPSAAAPSVFELKLYDDGGDPVTLFSEPAPFGQVA